MAPHDEQQKFGSSSSSSSEESETSKSGRRNPKAAKEPPKEKKGPSSKQEVPNTSQISKERPAKVTLSVVELLAFMREEVAKDRAQSAGAH